MKFRIDAPPFTGHVFELIAQDDLTWAEAGEVEAHLGASLVDLDDPEQGTRLRRSTRTMSVFLWASARRVLPEVTYADIAATPQRAVSWLREESPDPTEPVSGTDPTTEKPA